jgi:carboxypeptidase PM20D1
MVNGRILWWGVEVAQKRPLWLDVEAAGRPGHASGLQPHSAAHTLVAGLARLLARPPRWHVTPAARPYLAALAPLHSGKWRRIFSRIDEHIAPEGPKSGLLPGMANLFLDTVQVTRLTAGEQINVIPERASAQIDVRLLPDTDDSTFLAGARESLGSEITLRTLLVAPASAPAPAAGATWETLVRTLSGGKPVVPAFIAGFTDSRWFRERAIPAYGVMPFALEAEALAGIHGPDEHLSLAALADGVERMKRIVRALASE